MAQELTVPARTAVRTFDARALDKIKTLQQYDAEDLPTGVDHCSCPDPVCTASAAGASLGAGRGSGLCYLYADSNSPNFTFYTEVRNPLDPSSSARLGCLGQGGNDPLTQTLRQLYLNHAAQDVDWAFWNDQYQGTSDSYYADMCAYSSYSSEALPYKNCSADTDCGKRCKRSASTYRACTTDDDCESGDTCGQARRRHHRLCRLVLSCCRTHTSRVRRCSARVARCLTTTLGAAVLALTPRALSRSGRMALVSTSSPRRQVRIVA
eukprot:1253845-Prymnesium_polylepis.1